jgi:hypothetical protein
VHQPSTPTNATATTPARPRTLPRSARVRGTTPPHVSHWRHDLDALLSSLPEGDQNLIAWLVQPDATQTTDYAAFLGLTPAALFNRTRSAGHRLRINLREQFPDLATDVTMLAHQLGLIVPLETGNQMVRDTFGELPQLHHDLLLWLAGGYVEQRDCLGKLGTKQFDAVCAELADEHGVLPSDLADILLSHGCWPNAQGPVLERSPRVRRVGDRWVYLGKTTTDRVVAVLTALARPATLDEVRSILGVRRLADDVLAADPRLTLVGPRTFTVRPSSRAGHTA